MDQNTNLQELLYIAEKMVEAYHDPESNGIDQDSAVMLAEKILALDEWIRRGGALPDFWENSK